MSNALTYSIFAALSFGFWTVLGDAASKSIDSILGSILVSLAAVIFGVSVLLFSQKIETMQFSVTGLFFIVGAGVFAFLIDYFILKAFSLGMPAAVVGPIVIGGGILTASLLSSIIKGEFSLSQLFATILIVGGSTLLARSA